MLFITSPLWDDFFMYKVRGAGKGMKELMRVYRWLVPWGQGPCQKNSFLLFSPSKNQHISLNFGDINKCMLYFSHRNLKISYKITSYFSTHSNSTLKDVHVKIINFSLNPRYTNCFHYLWLSVILIHLDKFQVRTHLVF